jgi:hypothetical protein
MYPIDVEVLSLSDAERRYYSEFPLRFAQDEFLQERLAVSSRARVTLRHRHPCHRETVFVFLQQSLLAEVPALARSHFTEYNEHSDDLLENWTFLDFRGEHVRLRVYSDSLDGFFGIPDQGEPAFDMVYVCGPLVFVASHRPTPEQADIMLCSLQGCGICSGVNYRPHAIWSEEELESAVGAQRAPLNGVITAAPCRLHEDWRIHLGFPLYR